MQPFISKIGNPLPPEMAPPSLVALSPDYHAPLKRERQSGRLEWIDITRGFAAVMVMFHHYMGQTANGNAHFIANTFGDSIASILRHDLNLGVLGVALFFLISGYIIPASASAHSPRPVARFWISRIFRLYPLYWVSVLVAALVVGGTWTQIGFNLTMMQRFFGKPDLLGLYWTLQVELFFYVLISILLSRRLLGNSMISVWGAGFFLVLTGALASVRFFLHVKTPLILTMGLSLMFAGNFWYWFNHKKAFTNRQAFLFYTLFLGSIYAISYLGYHHDWGAFEEPSRFIVSDSLALLVFILMSRMVKHSVAPLVYLGAISYSIYLFHDLTMLILWDRIGFYTDGWERIFICSAISLVAAAVGFRWIEQPFIALGRAVITRKGWNLQKPGKGPL